MIPNADKSKYSYESDNLYQNIFGIQLVDSVSEGKIDQIKFNCIIGELINKTYGSATERESDHNYDWSTDSRLSLFKERNTGIYKNFSRKFRASCDGWFLTRMF